MHSNKSVAKNVMWNTVGSLFYLGIQWLITIFVKIISGEFGPVGVLSLAMSLSATFQTISNFGIRNFQVSDVEGKYSDSTYVGLRNVTCLLSIVLCFVFSLIMRYEAEQLWSIVLFMIFRIAESYSDVLHGIAQKADRLDIAGKSFCIKGLAILIGFFLPYYFSRSLCLSLLFMAIVAWLTTIFFDLLMTRRLSSFNLYDKASNCLKLAKETLPLFVYLFLFSTLTTIPKIFIEKMTLDEAALGAYSSIFSIATLFQMATGYVYTPFIHIFATHYHQKDMKRFFSSLAKVVAVMLVLALIAIVGATFLGEFALSLVFGDDIRPYSFLLNPILLSVFILSLLGFLFMIEVVIRDFRGLIIGNFVGFVLCTILTPILINSKEINGANLALIISGLASSAIVAISMLLKIRQNIRSQNE